MTRPKLFGVAALVFALAFIVGRVWFGVAAHSSSFAAWEAGR